MLDEKYLTKALTELNESEETRKKSLEEFRLFISKHDLLKNCRQDDKFLLQFLRTKKHNVERAVDLFERFMLLKSTYPKWFDFGQKEEQKIWELYETGFVYPLNRDDEGRCVILIQPQKIDPALYTFADIIRLLTRIAQILLEDEETQIAGFVVVTDFSNVTMSHLGLFPISQVINFVEIIRTSSIGRHKKMIMVALPSFGSVLLECAKRVMGEKLRNRIKIVKTMADIQNELNVSLLPLEHGGTIPEAVMIEKFREIVKERNETIRELANGVDWDKVALELDQDSCSIS